jgi:hypothetical protein
MPRRSNTSSTSQTLGTSGKHCDGSKPAEKAANSLIVIPAKAGIQCLSAVDGDPKGAGFRLSPE